MIQISNKSKRNISITFSTAFFEKNGTLVTSVSQEWPNLGANEKDFQLSSCVRSLPRTYWNCVEYCLITILISEPNKSSVIMLDDEESD